MVSHVLKGDLPSGPQNPPCLAKRAGFVRGRRWRRTSRRRVRTGCRRRASAAHRPAAI